MSDLGARIRQARKAQALTQEQLAQTLHVTRQTISNWENGRSTPDDEMRAVLFALLPLPDPASAAEQTESLSSESVSASGAPHLTESAILQTFGLFIRLHPLRAASAALLPLILLIGSVLAARPAPLPYTKAFFEQTQAAEPGKAHVRLYALESPVAARQNRPDATPIYACSVFFKEESGVGVSLDNVTLVYFEGERATFVDALGPEDFIDISLSGAIGANQLRRSRLNFPAENQTAVGYWATGTDDSGNPVDARLYLPLSRIH